MVLRNNGGRTAAKAGQHEPLSTTGKLEAVGSLQQPRAKSGGKRKCVDDGDRIPRKKPMKDNPHTAERTRINYQEPQGVRKSNRIAGRPADPLGPEPCGQYVQDGANSNSAPYSDPVSAQSIILAGSHHRPGSADRTQSESLNRETVLDGDAVATSQRLWGFLETLASNVSSHRIVRRLVDGYDKWIKRANSCVSGKYGLPNLEKQLRSMENDANASEDDLAILRERCRVRLEQLEECERTTHNLKEPIRNLNAKHADRNNRLYDYIDVTRGVPELQHLPAEFWTAFDRCCGAYTACRDVELDLHGVEQEQNDVFREVDTRVVDSVCQNAFASAQGIVELQVAAFHDPADVTYAQIRTLGTHSVSQNRLNELLKLAKEVQYEEESKLNEIAEDAFVAAGFMIADSGIDKGEVRLRLSSSSARDDGPFQEERGPNRLAARDLRSTAGGHRNGRLASGVRIARRRLENCRRRLEDSRRMPVSDAGSKNSTGEGEARFRRMKRRTQEVRAAEIEYRSVLNRARDARAMSESDQSSNFEDHDSDGYSDATLKALGFPMSKKRKDRVHKWMASTPRGRKRQQVKNANQNATSSGKVGSWVGRVNSMMVGEDPDYMSYDRYKSRIDDWNKERDRLRKEGLFEKAQNDFHPQNNPAVIDDAEDNQSRDTVYIELDDDDNEAVRQSPSNPSILYNPDSASGQFIDSDYRAAHWIEKHFNGSWPMRGTE